MVEETPCGFFQADDKRVSETNGGQKLSCVQKTLPIHWMPFQCT